MKKSAQKQSDSPAVESGMNLVKSIKNTLFRAVPIGGSCIVAGVIRSVEDETGTYGDYTRFSGDFAASVEGAVYRAGVMFLPDVAANVLKSGFLSAVDHTPEGSTPSIEFKISLHKRPDADEKNQNGFQWTAKPLLDPKPEEDKVLQLLA